MSMFDGFSQRRAGIGIPGGPRPQPGLAPPQQANTQEAIAGQVAAMNKNPWNATPNHDWASMGGKGSSIDDAIMGRARNFFGDESGALKLPFGGGPQQGNFRPAQPVETSAPSAQPEVNPWQRSDKQYFRGASKGQEINDTMMGRFFGDESGALKVPRLSGMKSGQASMAAPNQGFAPTSLDKALSKEFGGLPFEGAAPTPQAGGLSSAGEAAVSSAPAASGEVASVASPSRVGLASRAGGLLKGGAIGVGLGAAAYPKEAVDFAGGGWRNFSPSDMIPSGADLRHGLYALTTGHDGQGNPISGSQYAQAGMAGLEASGALIPAHIAENIGTGAADIAQHGFGNTKKGMEYIGQTLFGDAPKMQPAGPVVNGIYDPRQPAPVGTFNPIPEGPYREARLAALANPKSPGLQSVGISPTSSKVGVASTPQAAVAQSANQPAGPGAPGITPSQMAPPSTDPIEQGLRQQIQDVVSRNGRAGFVGNEQARDEWLASHLGMLNQYQHAGAQSEELRGRAAHYRTEAENPLGLPAGVDPAKVMGAKMQVPAESLQAQPWEANPALNAWSKQSTHDLPGLVGAVKTGQMDTGSPQVREMLNATMSRYFPNLPGLYKENAGGWTGQSEESKQGQELLRRLRPDLFPQQ